MQESVADNPQATSQSQEAVASTTTLAGMLPSVASSVLDSSDENTTTTIPVNVKELSLSKAMWMVFYTNFSTGIYVVNSFLIVFVALAILSLIYTIISNRRNRIPFMLAPFGHKRMLASNVAILLIHAITFTLCLISYLACLISGTPFVKHLPAFSLGTLYSIVLIATMSSIGYHYIGRNRGLMKSHSILIWASVATLAIDFLISAALAILSCLSFMGAHNGLMMALLAIELVAKAVSIVASLICTAVIVRSPRQYIATEMGPISTDQRTAPRMNWSSKLTTDPDSENDDQFGTQ